MNPAYDLGDDVLNELSSWFTKRHGGVRVRVVFDSSLTVFADAYGVRVSRRVTAHPYDARETVDRVRAAVDDCVGEIDATIGVLPA